MKKCVTLKEKLNSLTKERQDSIHKNINKLIREEKMKRELKVGYSVSSERAAEIMGVASFGEFVQNSLNNNTHQTLMNQLMALVQEHDWVPGSYTHKIEYSLSYNPNTVKKTFYTVTATANLIDN